ncbi:MAG TPA: class I SAM-dependent methyltransferase [Chitinophagaceae bacterium]|nr:class I SAM-dependent methyltransferase [Chitinophagaceae bacterium]
MTDSLPHITNEQDAAEAFTKQSHIFDALYADNPIIQYKRQRVRAHAGQFLQPRSHILELNAGTGEDAIYFAQQGHTVHATDVSTGMLQQLQQKATMFKAGSSISTELCSFTQLETLTAKGPYNLIFSNFAGLNCTGNLNTVLQSFNNLLLPGGVATMVIMPPFCLWETLLALRGNFKNAFRRFNSSKGVWANVEGIKFLCWYYKPSYIKKHLPPGFEILSVEGLCAAVPPSYFEGFPARHPQLYKKLTDFEMKHKNRWPWVCWGDYFIISIRKN